MCHGVDDALRQINAQFRHTYDSNYEILNVENFAVNEKVVISRLCDSGYIYTDHSAVKGRKKRRILMDRQIKEFG